MASKRKAALGFIFLTLLLDVTGFGIIIPIMPTLIRELTGGSLAEASQYLGWMLFAFSVMQFVFLSLVLARRSLSTGQIAQKSVAP